MAPNTICFINQKGGCGKSSTCFHLAGALARRSQRVLVIDMDPQGSLSQGFFGSALIESLRQEETVAAIFDDSLMPTLDELTFPTAFDLISIIRANQYLARHNSPAPENSGLHQFLLRSLVDHQAMFDVVLIDCPPNLYQCSWNALLASDYVIVPVPPEDFATQGLRTVHQAVQNAFLANPGLRLLGHLVTRQDSRLLVHRHFETKLREVYGDAVFATVVPELSAYKISLTCRQPAEYHAARSRAALVMKVLAEELSHRMASPADKRKVA